MPPKFIYFDLGNVLLHFDHHRGCRQMADVAGVDAEQLWQVIFETDLAARYERGQIATEEFYEELCQRIGVRPPYDELVAAGAAIFELNTPMVPVVGALLAAGYPLGLLSNTNPMHWEYVTEGRYIMIPGVFNAVVLSFRVGSMKPDRAIYEAAIEQAGAEPGEIFFVDDIAGHVEGARAAGLDAVQYTTPGAVVEELRRRSVVINY